MNNIEDKIEHITPTDGNIFVDLGFSSAVATKLKIKSQLMCQIEKWLKNKQLTQARAATILKVHRPRISDIAQGKTDKFTIDALLDMLDKTGQKVAMQIR
ncbi:MAG: transcriptional regulator [Gammaproteobacteria bacterium]|nr:MAG: transcriptional regulator [Gammaproteobacteria bacterium]